MSPEQTAALKKYRDSRDPLLHYTPNPMQLEFHRSPVRNKLINGSNRSGKTGALIADISMKLRGVHPYHPWVEPLRVWIWCPSRSQGAAVVGRKMFEKSELRGEWEKFPMIPAHEIEELGRLKIGGINVYQRCLLKNGSEVLFGWSGVDGSWKRFEGGQYHYVLFDENSCEGDLLNESMLRVADERDKHKDSAPWIGGIYWGATGTKVSDNFDRFKLLCEDKNQPDFAMFSIPASERAGFSKETMDAIGAGMTEEQRRIRLYGDSTAGDELRIYGRQWSDERHMRQSDYIVGPNCNLWLSWDPGVEHPAGMMFGAIGPENPLKIHIVKYIEGKRLTLEDQVELMCQYLRGRTLEGVVYDIASHKTESTGLSVKNQLLAILLRRRVRMIRGMMPGRNRHRDTIARVRAYLDPDPGNPFAEPLIDVNPSPESGGQLVRHQMLKYRTREAGKVTGPGGIVKIEDEACDCLRYLVSVTPAYNKDQGCGYPEPELPEPSPIPSQEALRDQARFRRSKDLWAVIEGRLDASDGGVSLW